MEGEDKISSIRQKARYNGQAFRAKKRSELRDAHRFDLDKVAEGLQIPDLDEVYKLCVQLKRKKDLHTLHKLRMGLSVGGESIAVFLNTEGALYALISCFTGNSAEMSREALNVFINLGLGTVEQCTKVYKQLSVYLMFRMNTKYSDEKDAGAWCIGNMCANSEEICRTVHSCGAEEQLCEYLKSPRPRVFQSVAYALTHYFATVPRRLRKNEIDGTVRTAIDGLEKFQEATSEIAWFMVVISSNCLVCEFMLCQGIIPSALCALQRVVNAQNLEVSPATALLRILLNCIGAFPRSAPQVCNRSEQFVRICTALLYSPHPHLRKETLQLIANAINGACQTASGQRLVEEQNLRPRLDSAVRSALASNFTLHPVADNFIDQSPMLNFTLGADKYQF